MAAGDADRAASWLLLREFRKATRFTRPGVDATVAVSALAAGRLAPRKATLEVRKDLLDAYQASLTTRLGEAEAAAERGFDARWAQTAALAAGLWPIVAPEYRTTAAAPPPSGPIGRSSGLRAALGAEIPAALPRLAPRSRRPSTGSSLRPSPAPSRPVAPPSSCAFST